MKKILTWKSTLIGMALVLIALSVTFQFLRLTKVPLSPANDLAMHVAITESFMIAIKSGQWFPITQNPPFYSHNDLPVFLYYGFMNGLSAIPGIVLSLPSITSLMLGVFLMRIFACFAIYWSGRLLGGNRKISILASLAFFMTPYVITTLYGRVAISEVLAHCEIPFLVLGLLLGLRGKRALGASVIAFTLVMLSLTHAIFLLYGSIAVVIMMLASFSRAAILTGFMGLASGVLLSTFRWYPGIASSKMMDYYQDGLPDIYHSLTSWIGLYSFPKSLGDILNGPGVPFSITNEANNLYLYLTPSWITLPCIAGLIFYLIKSKNRSLVLMILTPACIFFVLAYCIGNPFSHLPKILWHVQFPYRLLSFLGLFIALSLPILLPKIKIIPALLLGMVITIQSYALLTPITYNTPIDIPHHEIKTTFANNAFLMSDPHAIMNGSNELIPYSTNIYPINFHEKTPFKLTKEGFQFRASPINRYGNQYLNIVGNNGANNQSIEIWIENISDPSIKSPAIKLNDSSFSATIPMPISGEKFRLMAKSNTEETLNNRIWINSIQIMPNRTVKAPSGLDGPLELRMEGSNTLKERTEVWLANPWDPDTPLTGKLAIEPGKFSGILEFPDPSKEYLLVSPKYKMFALESPNTPSWDQRKFNLIFSNAEIVSKTAPLQPRITWDYIELKEKRPYSRVYTVKESKWWTPSGKSSHDGVIQLPMPYNPFFVVEQNGVKISTFTDGAARINFRTNDLTKDIIVKIRLPIICYLFPILGIFLLIGFRKKFN
jgi:hypothetical protein